MALLNLGVLRIRIHMDRWHLYQPQECQIPTNRLLMPTLQHGQHITLSYMVRHLFNSLNNLSSSHRLRNNKPLQVMEHPLRLFQRQFNRNQLSILRPVNQTTVLHGQSITDSKACINTQPPYYKRRNKHKLVILANSNTVRHFIDLLTVDMIACWCLCV